MAVMFPARLIREIKEIQTCNDKGNKEITIEIVDGINTNLIGTIKGPKDTPYSGGKFKLSILLNKNYPMKPPDVKFLTKVWHPNISSKTGYICVDFLNNQWTSTFTLESILYSLQLLMASPVPESAQEGLAGEQCIKDKDIFFKTANFWTHFYACRPENWTSGDYGFMEGCDEEYLNKFKTILEMGFSEDMILEKLTFNNWSVEETIATLINK